MLMVIALSRLCSRMPERIDASGLTRSVKFKQPPALLPPEGGSGLLRAGEGGRRSPPSCRRCGGEITRAVHPESPHYYWHQRALSSDLNVQYLVRAWYLAQPGHSPRRRPQRRERLDRRGSWNSRVDDGQFTRAMVHACTSAGEDVVILLQTCVDINTPGSARRLESTC